MKTLFLLSVLTVAVTYAYSLPPVADKRIDAAREQIVHISSTLSSGKRPTFPSLTELRSTLKIIQRTDALRLSAKLASDTKQQRDMGALDSALVRFEELQQLNLPVDSLRSIFLQIATTFEFTFCDYFHEQARKSHVKKVFLFSVSVSCECTLKMCGEYLDVLYALKRRYGRNISILIVDTFNKTDLKEKYKIDFVPTAVVLDEKNDEVQRFVREERIAEKLKHMFE